MNSKKIDNTKGIGDKVLLEDVNYVQMEIMESVGEGERKRLRVKGEFGRCDVPTRNGRIYSRSIYEKAIKELGPLMKKRAVFGELDHPDDSKSRLERVSHVITDLYIDNDGRVIGEAEILPTPAGKIVQALLESNVAVGVSSRGFGTTIQREGKTYVGEDFVLKTFDFVAEPADVHAYPDVMKEDVDYEAIYAKALEEGAACPPLTVDYIKEEIPELYEALKEDVEKELQVDVEVVEEDTEDTEDTEDEEDKEDGDKDKESNENEGEEDSEDQQTSAGDIGDSNVDIDVDGVVKEALKGFAKGLDEGVDNVTDVTDLDAYKDKISALENEVKEYRERESEVAAKVKSFIESVFGGMGYEVDMRGVEFEGDWGEYMGALYEHVTGKVGGVDNEWVVNEDQRAQLEELNVYSSEDLVVAYMGLKEWADKARENLKALREAVNDMEKREMGLKEDNNRLLEELDKKDRRIKEYRREIEALREDVEDLRASLKEARMLEKNVKRLEEDVDRLESELAAYRDRLEIEKYKVESIAGLPYGKRLVRDLMEATERDEIDRIVEEHGERIHIRDNELREAVSKVKRGRSHDERYTQAPLNEDMEDIGERKQIRPKMGGIRPGDIIKNLIF